MNECELCGREMITVYGSTDQETTKYCEYCGIPADAIRLIKQSNYGAMTISELELIVRGIMLEKGIRAAKTNMIYVDGELAGSLRDFLKYQRSTHDYYILFNGAPIKHVQDLSRTSDGSLAFETIKRGE